MSVTHPHPWGGGPVDMGGKQNEPHAWFAPRPSHPWTAVALGVPRLPPAGGTFGTGPSPGLFWKTTPKTDFPRKRLLHGFAPWGPSCQRPGPP